MSGSISRRNFLKGAAIGAGAMAVGGGGSALIRPRTAHATPIVMPLPLPATLLDPDEVAQLAFNHYRGGAGEG